MRRRGWVAILPLCLQSRTERDCRGRGTVEEGISFTRNDEAALEGVEGDHAYKLFAVGRDDCVGLLQNVQI